MSKIMVNPTLFITCRLCLDDLGVYQIVPEVQEQIKFCFDIDVVQFDGLPQLICNKCEMILNHYYEIKKKFIAKQAELKTRIPGANAVPSSPSGSVIVNTVENNIQPPIEKVTPPSAVVLPSVVLVPKVELSPVTLPSVTPPSVPPPSVITPSSWTKEYKKRFFCKFCNASYSAKKYLLVHLAKHKTIKAKFSTVFKKHCQVKLKKIDGKTNFTGSYDKVVYDKNKIIESLVADHYILYSNNKDRATSVNNKTYNYMDNIQYDSSDSHSEEIIRKKRSAKRRRIYSNSSTDTVVLDEGSNAVQKVEKVTDDDEDAWKSTNKKGNVTINIQNDGTINKIVELCCTKYISSQTQENKNLPETTGLQLKRKILSIGRKIINTKDFNSTALLRFLKYKNLDINWIHNRGTVDNNNFVKILTKMGNDKKDSNKKDEAGWQDHTPTQKDTLFTYEQLCNGCSNYEPATAHSIVDSNNHATHNEINVIDTSDSAVLSSLLLNDTKKLLNANPVANPKQLPKKNDKPTSDKVMTKSPSVSETEICMPIITSTTSLVETEAAPEPPRIKVKPASELLSKESMNRLNDASKTTPSPNQNDIVVTEVPNVFIIPSMQMAVPVGNVNISTFSNNSNHSMTSSSKPIATMMLDTPELPNTRTDSPFYYLRNLLQMHNIVLLNTDAVLSNDFVSLIKFKVFYKQEVKDRPVILCLSLHCHKNVFCLKVKDRNSADIDYPKISANWQWEILKIYTSDVVEKILINAMKVSQETYEYTNNFLCLLKTIKCTM